MKKTSRKLTQSSTTPAEHLERFLAVLAVRLLLERRKRGTHEQRKTT